MIELSTINLGNVLQVLLGNYQSYDAIIKLNKFKCSTHKYIVIAMRFANHYDTKDILIPNSIVYLIKRILNAAQYVLNTLDFFYNFSTKNILFNYRLLIMLELKIKKSVNIFDYCCVSVFENKIIFFKLITF